MLGLYFDTGSGGHMLLSNNVNFYQTACGHNPEVSMRYGCRNGGNS
jgi:hypothetical protein